MLINTIIISVTVKPYLRLGPQGDHEVGSKMWTQFLGSCSADNNWSNHRIDLETQNAIGFLSGCKTVSLCEPLSVSWANIESQWKEQIEN